MALTVGELTALVSVDPDGVDRGLRDAEASMRTSGRRMGDDAERAGQQAGTRLGEGLATAGQQGADTAVGGIGERLGGIQAAAAGVGVAAGAVLMAGFQEAMNQGQIVGKLRAQLGATAPEAARYGKIAGALFKDAIVADFQEGANTIKAIASSGLIPPGATNAQIKSIATNAADLANTFDLDVTEAAKAAGSMLKNGLAKDGREAFDLLAASMNGLGPASDDLMETITEYGPIFKSAGISGQTAMGLIRQAIQGGWSKDTDKIADAFKEFNLRATEGSKGVQDAFKTLGLDAKQTGDDIAAGGLRGEKAMGGVLDKLRELGPNSQEAKQIVSTLFGGPGEDLGAALFALDVDKAGKAMGGAAGEGDKLGSSLRDNAGSQITAFRNTMQQNLVEFLGGTVIPALMGFFGFVSEHSTAFKLAALVITSVLVPALILMGVTATVRAAQVVTAWVTSGLASLTGAATHVGSALRVVGAWIMMGVQSILQAGRMAAAWFIALGPVGWVIATIVGLVALIIANWDTVKRWTGMAWDWVVAKVTSAAGMILAGASLIGQLPGMVGGYFGRMKDAAVRKASELLSWMRGLPGRLRNALGSMGGLLVGKGADVVRGLWNGIKSMGGWIKNQIMGWAKSVIPGPVAKALGIASPSKVMAAQVGRWIPAGIIEGVEAGTPALDRTMAGLVETPGPGATMGMSGSTAGRSGARGRTAPQVVVLQGSGSAYDEAMIGTLREIDRKLGGALFQVA